MMRVISCLASYRPRKMPAIYIASSESTLDTCSCHLPPACHCTRNLLVSALSIFVLDGLAEHIAFCSCCIAQMIACLSLDHESVSIGQKITGLTYEYVIPAVVSLLIS